MTDRYDLQRFVDAQADCYGRVCDELRSGHKRGHWIWFIFPQLTGLGTSPTAIRYGISSLGEARAYLAHPVLGPRLRECCRLLTALHGPSITAVVGRPDDLKVRSSATLFREAAGEDGADGGDSEFQAVLRRYYGGEPDPLTLDLLSAGRGPATRAGAPPSG